MYKSKLKSPGHLRLVLKLKTSAIRLSSQGGESTSLYGNTHSNTSPYRIHTDLVFDTAESILLLPYNPEF